MINLTLGLLKTAATEETTGLRYWLTHVCFKYSVLCFHLRFECFVKYAVSD